MKSLLVVIVSAAIASLLFWGVGTAFGNVAGAVAANAALFLLLLTYAATRSRRIGVGAMLASSVGGTAFLGLCTMAGTLVFDQARVLGFVLMAAVSVGYYPPGPDVPLIPGLSLWGASAIIVIIAGLGSGTLIRTVRRGSPDASRDGYTPPVDRPRA